MVSRQTFITPVWAACPGFPCRRWPPVQGLGFRYLWCLSRFCVTLGVRSGRARSSEPCVSNMVKDRCRLSSWSVQVVIQVQGVRQFENCVILAVRVALWLLQHLCGGGGARGSGTCDVDMGHDRWGLSRVSSQVMAACLRLYLWFVFRPCGASDAAAGLWIRWYVPVIRNRMGKYPKMMQVPSLCWSGLWVHLGRRLQRGSGSSMCPFLPRHQSFQINGSLHWDFFFIVLRSTSWLSCLV